MAASHPATPYTKSFHTPVPSSAGPPATTAMQLPVYGLRAFYQRTRVGAPHQGATHTSPLLMGLDVGRAKVGVSLSCDQQRIAAPILTLHRQPGTGALTQASQGTTGCVMLVQAEGSPHTHRSIGTQAYLTTHTHIYSHTQAHRLTRLSTMRTFYIARTQWHFGMRLGSTASTPPSGASSSA